MALTMATRASAVGQAILSAAFREKTKAGDKIAHATLLVVI
jgi:hypothetical protein